MSYEPTVWKTGDVVTSDKLNKLENGVAGAGGGALIVHVDATGTLDKTWAEINAAAPLVFISESGNYIHLAYVQAIANGCECRFYSVDSEGTVRAVTMGCDSPDEYPYVGYEPGGGGGDDPSN